MYISTQYNQFKQVEDIKQAIVLVRDALLVRSPEHSHRSRSLISLASYLTTRYSQFEEIDGLDEAIVLARDALALCPLGHPDRSRVLENLAQYLRTRFTQSSQSKDKEELFSLYATLAHVSPTVSSTDLSAARAWIDAAEEFQHPTTPLAYHTSLRLLAHHLAALSSLPQHLTLLKDLMSSLAADSFSACLRHCSPNNAVELLEQGRGVLLEPADLPPFPA
ncbi:hypothetical protein J3R83DRAFT_3698 [Lanmaoa asiatica]|nr:hypothetical protein J3R83DRAFT_3698 [Lanmaoa asiatica]